TCMDTGVAIVPGRTGTVEATGETPSHAAAPLRIHLCMAQVASAARGQACLHPKPGAPSRVETSTNPHHPRMEPCIRCGSVEGGRSAGPSLERVASGRSYPRGYRHSALG